MTPRRQNRAAFSFLALWLCGLLLVTIGPMLASLWLSFNQYTLGAQARWVGFDNYINLFTNDHRFVTSAIVTLKYVGISIPLQLSFALLVATALDRGIRGMTFYRSVYYLPSLLGGSVAVAIIWRQLFASDGPIASVAGVFGIQMQSWISNPDRALWSLIVLNVWTFGSPMVIFLAGLRQIPGELLEAARVDGAGGVRTFWHVTLPLLTPVVFFNLILQVIQTFQAFTPAYVVSSGTGGPADSTLFYTLYMFQVAFTSYNMGYASAMAWILLGVIGLLTAINFWASKYWVHYES